MGCPPHHKMIVCQDVFFCCDKNWSLLFNGQARVDGSDVMFSFFLLSWGKWRILFFIISSLPLYSCTLLAQQLRILLNICICFFSSMVQDHHLYHNFSKSPSLSLLPKTIIFCNVVHHLFYDCQSSPREEVEEFFASMDRDFDGRLSFEEFMGEVVLIQLSQSGKH